MFYNIAVVQNEKELFNYDHADWKNKRLLKSSNLKTSSDMIGYDFRFYNFKFFDENTIISLFDNDNLMNFDCICFSMNAFFNKSKVYEYCCFNKDKIEKFLLSGKGLFIGFSNRIENFDFLPERYQFSQIITNTENPSIFFSNSPILNMHVPIDKNAYLSRTATHNTVRGIYHHYFEKTNVYDILIYDKVMENILPLMICTNYSEDCRIVATTLPIDWQDQDDLFFNIIKYCVEGLPKTKIFLKHNKKNNSHDYNVNFLFRQLNINKIPYAIESISEISKAEKHIDLFDNLIFNETFKSSEVEDFCSKNLKKIIKTNTRIIHHTIPKHDKDTDSFLYNLIIHSGFQKIESLKKYTKAFFKNKIQENYKFGTYEAFEMISYLEDNAIIDDTVKFDIIKSKLEKYNRISKDGSYDNMFVATCVFLALCCYCIPENMKNKYQDTVFKLTEYIKNKLNFGEVSNYEKAHALYLMCKVNDKNSELFTNEEFKDLFEILLEQLKVENFQNYNSYSVSNCIKATSLYLYNKISNSEEIPSDVFKQYFEYLNIILKIIDVYDDIEIEHKIMCLSNIAFSLITIIKINKILDRKGFNKQNDYLEMIYYRLFDIVGVLNYSIDNYLTDILKLSVVMKTLTEFFMLNLYPTDEIILLLQSDKFKEENIKSVVTKMSDLNKRQFDNISKLNEKVLKLEIENKNYLVRRKKENKINFIYKICTILFFAIVLEGLYAFFVNRDVLLDYLSLYKSYFTWFIGIIVLVPTAIEIFKIYRENKNKKETKK